MSNFAISEEVVFTAEIIMNKFESIIKEVGEVNTCRIDNLLNVDFYEQNRHLICDGLPCGEDDFECIRVERGKKYDQFCTDMINPEYQQKITSKTMPRLKH